VGLGRPRARPDREDGGLPGPSASSSRTLLKHALAADRTEKPLSDRKRNAFSALLFRLLSPQERHAGLLPRWHVSFNITALRLLSFALDHHWAHLEADAGSAAVDGSSRSGRPADDDEVTIPLVASREGASDDLSPPSRSSVGPPVSDAGPSTQQQQQQQQQRQAAATAAAMPPPSARVRSPRPLAEYTSVTGCLAHALYTPLYVAGPIVSFNDFAAQVREDPPPLLLSISLLRCASCVLPPHLPPVPQPFL